MRIWKKEKYNCDNVTQHSLQCLLVFYNRNNIPKQITMHVIILSCFYKSAIGKVGVPLEMENKPLLELGLPVSLLIQYTRG